MVATLHCGLGACSDWAGFGGGCLHLGAALLPRGVRGAPLEAMTMLLVVRFVVTILHQVSDMISYSTCSVARATNVSFYCVHELDVLTCTGLAVCMCSWCVYGMTVLPTQPTTTQGGAHVHVPEQSA
jgi:hypothetical protein